MSSAEKTANEIADGLDSMLNSGVGGIGNLLNRMGGLITVVRGGLHCRRGFCRSTATAAL